MILTPADGAILTCKPMNILAGLLGLVPAYLSQSHFLQSVLIRHVHALRLSLLCLLSVQLFRTNISCASVENLWGMVRSMHDITHFALLDYCVIEKEKRSVAIILRNFSVNVLVKECWKSVSIKRIYGENVDALLLTRSVSNSAYTRDVLNTPSFLSKT